MVKAVIFDWGGVLIDSLSRAVVSYCAHKLGVNEDALQDAVKKHMARFESGLMTEEELWLAVNKDLSMKLPTKPLWKEAFAHLYNERPEMFSLIDSLKKNYKIGFLSNCETPAMEFFLEKGYKQFDATVFSCKVGLLKPEPGIYELILDKLGIVAEEAVFIDDKKKNIEAAEALGIKVVLFESPEQVISDLRELGLKLE